MRSLFGAAIVATAMSFSPVYAAEECVVTVKSLKSHKSCRIGSAPVDYLAEGTVVRIIRLCVSSNTKKTMAKVAYKKNAKWRIGYIRKSDDYLACDIKAIQ